MVVLKDRYRNLIRVIETKGTKVSVQYSSQEKPQSMRFLECSTTLKSNVGGDAYFLSCSGAENERIYFYPSINNVPLGGQDRYEVTTTLCPGKSTCEGNQHSISFFSIRGVVGKTEITHIEQFSTEGRKIKTKVIALANHN